MTLRPNQQSGLEWRIEQALLRDGARIAGLEITNIKQLKDGTYQADISFDCGKHLTQLGTDTVYFKCHLFDHSDAIEDFNLLY